MPKLPRIALSNQTVAWALGLAVLIAWGNTLNGWFANDDFLWLDISRPGSVLQSFAGSAGVVNDFRPLVRLAFLIEWELFGAQPFGWHLVNLLLQFGCSVLIWRLIAPWLGASVGMLTALLFAVQPVLEENVAWISGLSGELSLMFALLSVLWFVRYLREPRVLWLVAFVAADVAAISSYEPMVLLPLMHVGIGLAQKRRPWGALAGLLLAHALLLVYRRLVLGPHVSYPFRPVAFGSLLAVLHDYRGFMAMLAVIPWLLIPGVVALMFRRNRDLALGAIVGLGSMALALATFMVFYGVASRFFYAAAVGAALFLAVMVHAAARLLPRGGGLAFVVVMGLLLLNIEITKTRRESVDWTHAGRLGQELMTEIAAADPNPNPRALHVIVDLPISLGDGGLFFTFPDRAIRRFTRLPFDAVFSGSQLVYWKDPQEINFLRKSIANAGRSDASQGLDPLSCLEDRVNAASSTAVFLHKAQDCGLDVLRVENGTVHQMSADDFYAWYNGALKP